MVCVQSDEGASSSAGCTCKAGRYVPPLKSVLLAGSSKGKLDGAGSGAKFYSPRMVAVSPDGTFILVSGLCKNGVLHIV